MPFIIGFDLSPDRQVSPELHGLNTSGTEAVFVCSWRDEKALSALSAVVRVQGKEEWDQAEVELCAGKTADEGCRISRRNSHPFACSRRLHLAIHANPVL